MNDVLFPKTYIIVDTDGTILEQSLRGTEAYLCVAEDIASGQCDAARVYKLHNGSITDVSDAIEAEVYAQVYASESEFVPGFLKLHTDRLSYNVLLASKRPKEQRRHERAEDAADRARDDRLCAA